MATIAALASTGPAIFCLAAQQMLAQSPPTATTPATITTAPSAASFDVASIKLDRLSGSGIHVHVSSNNDSFIATGVTAKNLIELAYEVKDFQISGGPGWADSEKYAINAKIDEESLEALKKLAPAQAEEQRQLMLQSLLTERFNLKISHSSKELPIYVLVVSKNGPKLSPTADASGHQGFSSNKRGEVKVTGAPMTRFADWLSRQLGRKVVDKTGLQGQYDFTLHWTPERLTPISGSAADNSQGPAPSQSDSSAPSIFTALQEQLGLKLESKKGPVEILVIDSIDRPSEN